MILGLLMIFFMMSAMFLQSDVHLIKNFETSKSKNKEVVMITGKVTITGKAFDSKAGALLVTEENESIYIDQLDYWPDDCIGKTISVTGIIVKTDAIPKAGKPTDKLTKQGAEGEQTIIKNSTWTIME